jgi:hypothetical protein
MTCIIDIYTAVRGILVRLFTATGPGLGGHRILRFRPALILMPPLVALWLTCFRPAEPLCRMVLIDASSWAESPVRSTSKDL